MKPFISTKIASKISAALVVVTVISGCKSGEGFLNNFVEENAGKAGLFALTAPSPEPSLSPEPSPDPFADRWELFKYESNPVTYAVGVAIAENRPTKLTPLAVRYEFAPSAAASALPAGLVLDPNTGAIRGTPTQASSATSYVIRGISNEGSSTATLTITVLEGPKELRYATPVTYSVGVAIVPNRPSSTGGAITKYEFVPSARSSALPAGLALDPGTGVISGTPTQASGATEYLIRGYNAITSVQASVVMTVLSAPTTLRYTTPVTYIVGTAIANNGPTSSGGAITRYEFVPSASSSALPAGLALNATTGVISGTPTLATVPRDYVIRGINAVGSVQAVVNITVLEAPRNLAYTTPVTYYVGTPIAPNVPTYSGGAITSFEFVPSMSSSALPPGLTVNATTGVISGTPTQSSAATGYVIRGKNRVGYAQTLVTMTVIAKNGVTEQFALVTSQKKRIDFLFVVDNSISMENNQAKLAAGFQRFAETYFKIPDLNICTAITTSDRYLCGDSGDCKYNTGVRRDRYTSCTNPDGSENWDSATRLAYNNSIIQDFTTKVKVGATGYGIEFLGKSAVDFLYQTRKWGDPIDPNRLNPFFRRDAIANITFLTDENNYCPQYIPGLSTSPDYLDETCDLPTWTGHVIPEAPKEYDSRTGIYEYLNAFFSKLTGKPTSQLTYSVTALTTVTPWSDDPVEAPSRNLDPLPALVGRDSVKGDIGGTADYYAEVYRKVGTAINNRFYNFKLAHVVYEPDLVSNSLHDLRVYWVKVNGTRRELAFKVDYDLSRTMDQINIINLTLASQFGLGDKLEVRYVYR